MARLPITICRVDTAKGPQDYVTCLSHEHVLAHGLPANAILGVLLRSLEAGEPITPDNFAQNRTFVNSLE